MKKVKCKIDNRWYWSIESAGLLIESPQGGHVWIRKGAVADSRVSEQAKDLIRTIGNFANSDSIEITVADMYLLLETAKTVKGCFYRTKHETESVFTS